MCMCMYDPLSRTRKERMKGGGMSVGDTLGLTGGTRRLWQWMEASNLGLGATLSTTAGRELVLAGSIVAAKDTAVQLSPTTVWTVPDGAQEMPEGRVAPLVFGFDVPAGGMISAMLEDLGTTGFGSSSCGTLSNGYVATPEGR